MPIGPKRPIDSLNALQANLISASSGTLSRRRYPPWGISTPSHGDDLDEPAAVARHRAQWRELPKDSERSVRGDRCPLGNFFQQFVDVIVGKLAEPLLAKLRPRTLDPEQTLGFLCP